TADGDEAIPIHWKILDVKAQYGLIDNEERVKVVESLLQEFEEGVEVAQLRVDLAQLLVGIYEFERAVEVLEELRKRHPNTAAEESGRELLKQIQKHELALSLEKNEIGSDEECKVVVIGRNVSKASLELIPADPVEYFKRKKGTQWEMGAVD